MEDEMQQFWLVLVTVMAVATLILLPISYLLGELSMREPPDLARLFKRSARPMPNHPPRALYGPVWAIDRADFEKFLIGPSPRVIAPVKAINSVVEKSVIGQRPALIGGVLPYLAFATVVQAERRMGM